jgi:hypothetical protein
MGQTSPLVCGSFIKQVKQVMLGHLRVVFKFNDLTCLPKLVVFGFTLIGLAG